MSPCFKWSSLISDFILFVESTFLVHFFIASSQRFLLVFNYNLKYLIVYKIPKLITKIFWDLAKENIGVVSPWSELYDLRETLTGNVTNPVEISFLFFVLKTYLICSSFLLQVSPSMKVTQNMRLHCSLDKKANGEMSY